LRAIRRAKLPIWYTEGCNPHPYITFLLPLSLGFESDCECMEIKVSECVTKQQIARDLSRVMTDGFTITGICDPVKKVSELCWSDYEILLDHPEKTLKQLCDELKTFFACEEIIVDKKTKAGTKKVDIKKELVDFGIAKTEQAVKIFMRLPAGSAKNVNPMLFFNEVARGDINIHLVLIKRTRILTADFADFE